LTDPADIETLKILKLVGAIMFDELHDDQWARLVEAIYLGTQDDGCPDG
jgi:hypothetical protein